MFYIHYIDTNGDEHSDLMDDCRELYSNAYDPNVEIFSMINFTVRGKDYASRQASLCDIARRFQYECAPGLSMLEMSLICDWFYKYGKRYGLLRDFIENGIC